MERDLALRQRLCQMSDGRMSRMIGPVDVEAFANMAIICGQCRGGGAMWEKISIWQRLVANMATTRSRTYHHATKCHQENINQHGKKRGIIYIMQEYVDMTLPVGYES